MLCINTVWWQAGHNFTPSVLVQSGEKTRTSVTQSLPPIEIEKPHALKQEETPVLSVRRSNAKTQAATEKFDIFGRRP